VSEEKKGDLAINIANSVIEEALRSVEKHTGKSVEPAAPEPKAPAPPAAAAAPLPAAPATGPAPAATAAPGSDETKKLKNDVLEARQALRQREAELETSQEMGRATLAKLKDQHERTLRAVADLDNFKKRVVKEREDTARFGQEKLLREFLPVLDNLDRALEHAKSAADFEGLKSGILMTRKHFEDMLARFGVKGFSALGKVFDPKMHEAIQQMESDQPVNTIVHEVVRGFTLHDRLMRPAMVAVAKPRPGPVEGPKASAAAPAEPAPAAAGQEPSPSPEAPAGAAPPDAEKPQS
jgi:molecular chaperone GrpE